MITVAAWRRRHADLDRLDADLLLCRTLHCSRVQLLTEPDQPLTTTQLAGLDDLAARRRRGEPVAYLLGYREFWGITLTVTPAVLVPRPETELLVEQTLTQARNWAGAQPPRLLDLGTGSGAIAIALARELDQPVTATDRDPAALAIARTNATRHGVDLRLVASDWFTALSGRFDLIVANPPYVAEDDPHLAALHAEPAAALTAGADGLRDLRLLVAGTPDHLAAGGWLLLEHGYDQGAAVRALLQQRGFTRVETFRDLAGHERVTQAQWESIDG